jgi:heptosyltransferase-2
MVWSVTVKEKMDGKKVSLAARAPNWLGDAILAVPAVRGLVECSPRGRVVILASTVSSEVFSRIPGTLVFGIRRPGAGAVDSLRALVKGASILRSFGPVLTFGFTGSSTSAAMCFLGGSARRVGFSHGSLSFLYTDRVPPGRREREHLTETYCRLVESMGIKITNRVPDLEPAENDRLKGRRVLEDHGLAENGYVCMFPGARYGPAKCWEHSRFALLGDTVVDRLHLRVVLLGSGQDAAVCRAVGEEMVRESLNLCDKLDFSSLVGVLSLCRAAVSNDSGGMHLAASLGVPTVGLFFSTDPRWTRPLSPRSIALYNKMDCSPCFARDCRLGNPCTQNITVDEVTGALEKITRIQA